MNCKEKYLIMRSDGSRILLEFPSIERALEFIISEKDRLSITDKDIETLRVYVPDIEVIKKFKRKKPKYHTLIEDSDEDCF